MAAPHTETPGSASLDWEAIYQDRIHPGLAVPIGAVTDPRWIFVCGQQGSSKSTRIKALRAELGRDRTQLVSSDNLSDHLPELYADPDDPAVQPLLETFRSQIRQVYVDRLVEHAVGMRAHIVWELPIPGNIEGWALVARTLGYRVECVVMALPAVESWLATLTRWLAASAMVNSTSPAVPWTFLSNAYLRWPPLIARAEANATFDRITIIDRDGTLCFENEVQVQNEDRHWTSPAFGFESLVIERARARSPAACAALLTQWDAIRSHPEIALRNREAWPWQSLVTFDRLLRDLAADPGTGFDLNDPGAARDPMAASRWIARLRAELDATLTAPEAEGQTALAARADRLIDLVSQIAGQPTR